MSWDDCFRFAFILWNLAAVGTLCFWLFGKVIKGIDE